MNHKTLQKITIWQPNSESATVYVYRRNLIVAKVYTPTSASIRRLNRILRHNATVTNTWFTASGLSVDYRL